jgi:hypothetical protein
MPQKRILMTEMPQPPKNYQNDSNAMTFFTTFFTAFVTAFSKKYQNDLNATLCSLPLGVLVAWHIEAQDTTTSCLLTTERILYLFIPQCSKLVINLRH